MRKENVIKSYEKLHFVGIGGVSMSGLANYALTKNKVVSGSDLTKTHQTEQLERLGASIYYFHSSLNVGQADAVIATSAVDDNNPEIIQANKIGLPIFNRSQALGGVMDEYKNSVAIAGSHGKTTATAMLSVILIEGQFNPTVFLGGESALVNRFRKGDSDFIVVEACEYKKNLLYLAPKIAVVLNVDNDHMDCYKNMNDMVETFRCFTENSLTVLNADDTYTDALFNGTTVTFGIERNATYLAKEIKFNGKGYSFRLYRYGMPIIRINLGVFGYHNIYNALSACAVADLLGVNHKTIKYALENFSGVKRRNEFLGEVNGVEFFADYAHHPKEIKATLKAYKECGQKVLTIFQPHTYSRTKNLLYEFVNVLNEGCCVYQTYPAREEYDRLGSAKRICEELKRAGKECRYLKDEKELYKAFDEIEGPIKVLVLGAGDVYDLTKKYIEEQKKI